MSNYVRSKLKKIKNITMKWLKCSKMMKQFFILRIIIKIRYLRPNLIFLALKIFKSNRIKKKKVNLFY